jgi:hypothetical protein
MTQSMSSFDLPELDLRALAYGAIVDQNPKMTAGADRWVYGILVNANTSMFAGYRPRPSVHQTPGAWP